MELLDEGEMVDIPDLEIEDLIEENTLSVIVRCLNPYAHKVGGLVKALPPIWGLEDRVRGRGVGEHRAQFIFSSENDLQHVLTKGPWFVNGWIVSLDQWSPNPPPEFLQRIPFWIRIRGLPIHMLKKEIVESLMGPLGRVGPIELHAKNSNSLEYVRAQVMINTEEPLQFRRTARFKSGTIIPTELEYEKLLKVCYTCKRLTHDQSRCPMQVETAQLRHRESIGQSKEENLRRKLVEKESKAKEALNKNAEKGVVFKNVPTVGNPRGSLRGRKNVPSESNREDKRKGKRVASTPQLVWKQKGERVSSRTTRSTEESIANQPSSAERSIQKHRKSTSEEAPAPVSVFGRLGSAEGRKDLGGSSERRSVRTSSDDLRVLLSGGSQEERMEGADRVAAVREDPSAREGVPRRRRTRPHQFSSD
ncbi:Uncharacterized protein Rs2_39127 [Raphanus sativus]|nr:Uncharacterized protein Rs2_39127 [Raphanus sativus]